MSHAKTKPVDRCPWCGADPDYIAYHDREWGVALFDDRALFEMLILEGQQAGLSWLTILRKRENFRRAFNDFDADKIARYRPQKIDALLTDPGIIRHRLKIEAVVKNARAYLELQGQPGGFAEFVWQFAGDGPKINHWRNMAEVPASTPASDAMSKALKKRGFSFVGSTICYAYMQAVGMVNDHLVSCYRHAQLA